MNIVEHDDSSYNSFYDIVFSLKPCCQLCGGSIDAPNFHQRYHDDVCFFWARRFANLRTNWKHHPTKSKWRKNSYKLITFKSKTDLDKFIRKSYERFHPDKGGSNCQICKLFESFRNWALKDIERRQLEVILKT